MGNKKNWGRKVRIYIYIERGKGKNETAHEAYVLYCM